MSKKTRLSRRIFSILLTCVMMLGMVPTALAAPDGVQHILLNKVYGGSTDGYASHSFIELYNPTDEAVDLNGYSLQYRSSADGGNNAAWAKLDLTGEIPAGGYYLVRCAAVADTGNVKVNVPEGDQEWDIVLHNKGVSVALMGNQIELSADVLGDLSGDRAPEGLVDLAAASGNDYNGGGETDKEYAQLAPAYEGDDFVSQAGIQSKKKAASRTGFADTDNTAADFAAVDYSKTVEDINLPHASNSGEADLPDFAYPWDDNTDVKLAVISDDHLYDTDALGADGVDFDSYLAGDRKMLVESEKILDAALAQIKNSGADYLLISGDLTKDGEKLNHELLAQKLAAFEAESGTQVFVINGNHDISNAHAVSYKSGSAVPAETVDTAMFKDIYAEAGYDLAVAEDPDSLSYAADLGGSYRLIVMDACIYNNDTENPEQHTGGEFSDETMAWVLSQIEEARREGRIPIGMMHHGLVPHTAIQPDFFSEYLVKDYSEVSAALADAGMSLVFTGHFHSQDAAYITTEAGNVLHDVETGSLVTDPSPIRYVALEGDKAAYASSPILEVAGLTKDDLSAPELFDGDAVGEKFPEYAHNYLLTGLEGQVAELLVGMGMDAALADYVLVEKNPEQGLTEDITLAKFLSLCMSFHYEGDEDAALAANPMKQVLEGIIAKLKSDTTSFNGMLPMLANAAEALIHDTQTPGDSAEPLGDNTAAFVLTGGEDLPVRQTLGFENSTASLKLTNIGRYSSGETNKDGGVMEIVAYAPGNKCAYAINGQSGKLAVIPMSGMTKGQTTVTVLDGESIDVKGLVSAEGFTYGDMTSVAVSPDGKTLAAAIQAKDYAANGRVALFTIKDDGTLEFQTAAETGVQPDMVTFTPNGSKILTANEGEPRMGYTYADAVDPKGSVTVIDVKSGTAETIGFEKYDAADARQALVDADIVLKKDTAPSVDLEPEYIACSNTTAYITLQEANAVAVLDLNTNDYRGIFSVGFEDYSSIAVDINGGDDGYSPEIYENLLGIRMPDGISMTTIGGVDYILTANEGDSRAWPLEDISGTDIEAESDSNEVKNKQSPSGNINIAKKVTWFKVSDYDGLDAGTDYLFGGRSFTMFKVTANGLEQVFDSTNDFETKTADYLPDYFNCSNDDTEKDSRSGKKGPEPESVVTGTVDGRTYAFVTLERIGGIMVYDITNPAKVSYVNYINSRDFVNVDEDGVGADDSPEGLAFVPASQSPTGGALLLAACEVGGTVAVYDLASVKADNGGSGTGGSSASGYPISTEQSSHGTVTVSPRRADKGDTVTISVKPDNGYELKSIKVLDKNGSELELTEKNGKYTFTMPASKVSVEAVFTEREQTSASPFKDVNKNDYYYASVLWAVENGVTSGTAADAFSPDAACTRAQTVTFLWRAMGSPEPDGTQNPFTDVSADAYYCKAVLWAAEKGITKGSTELTFDPDAEVTRAQAVTFLWRAVGSPEPGTANPFADVAANTYYTDAVLWAAHQGISSGTGADTFSPDSSCLRAQIVTFLYRAIAG
ncbi:MAG: choice-of-anchor I family protein [Candidatus Heteroscillospira sp.]|jgi:3',5'-cyclic AMP phosphodiesterase CpdA